MSSHFLECTHDHPVFVLGKGYITAAAIQPGDELLSPAGIKKVKSVELNLPAPEFVYNLTTEPQHNFFANGVLTHNCDDPIDPKRAVSEAELKTAADFVTNILPSRKVDKAVAVTTLVMQRLHSCLVGNTVIDTFKGPKFIQDVRADELILTRQGWKWVKWSGETKKIHEIYRLELSEGDDLQGTAEHLIWTLEHGWQPLCLIRPGWALLHMDGRTTHALRSSHHQRVENTPVYDLEVEDSHEFFANGILVHNSDPTGILLEKSQLLAGVGRIRHICLPARLADNVQPPELREKYIDGLMDPVRLPEIVLREQEMLLGAYSFSGQYQQSPVPLSGGMFRIEFFNKRAKAAPYNCNRILYVDRASTQDGGCYTAMVLMARSLDGSEWFIEHCVHGQWEPDERNRKTLAEALRCRARYGPSNEPSIYIEAEGGSSGRDAFKGVARALTGFAVREHRPTGKKSVRAEPLASQWAAGNMTIVDDGTWDINNYIQEHIHFPLGKYMDQVDASSGAFALLIQQRPTGGLRSYTLSHKKKQALRILICTPEQLINFSTVQRCLLIYLSDPLKEVMSHVSDVRDDIPGSDELFQARLSTEVDKQRKEVMSNEGRNAASEPIDSHRTGNRASSGEDQAAAGDSPADNYVDSSRREVMPTHGLPHVLDTLHLRFLNASPADYQNTWLEPVAGYDVLPEKLLLSKTQCKQLWQRITIHRDPWIENIILVDEDTNRSLSIGYAFTDALSLPRDATLGQVGKEDGWAKRNDIPPNTWLFEQVRSGRNLVV